MTSFRGSGTDCRGIPELREAARYGNKPAPSPHIVRLIRQSETVIK